MPEYTIERRSVEAMPKTIKRTLSGSEMAPPFHRTRRISLNYCAAYFFRKDGVCVVLAYFFPSRVRRLFLPGTLQVRSKHVNDTVRYGNFFLTPTVCTCCFRMSEEDSRTRQEYPTKTLNLQASLLN